MAPEASDSEANPRMANDSVDDKKHSWASEVEEDQDATGWRLQQEAAGSTSLPVYPSEPTKQKKFKKKKKNNSHHQHSSKAVKQERERLETAPNSMGGSRFEAEFKDLNVSVDRMSGQNSHTTPHDDVGWQVTSSQKASHAQSSHTLPLSNHSFPSPPCRPGPGMLPTPGLRYAQPDVAGPFGGHGEGAGYGGKVKAGSLGGRGEGAGYGGKVNAGLFGEHGEGTSYGGKLNVGNAQPARNSEPLLVQPWGVPDAPPQRSRSYPDASKAISQNSGCFQVYESESSNKRNWREHSQPQRIVESQLYSQSSTDDARKVSTTLVAHQACSIGCSNVQKGQQVHVNDWDISPPVSTAKEELNKTQMNPNILIKLLPSERGEEREFLKSGSSGTSGSLGTKMNNRISFPPPEFDDLPCTVDSDSACSDGDLDDDSDWIGSDPFDSDGSVKSLDTRKQNKWLRSFFYTLDDFTNEQILEHDRQWHCPACQGGVGAIVWYRGLQPLIAHAKTHRTKRIGLHREFAKVLEEELEMRRAGTGSLGETKFGKWKGLRNDDAAKNPLIVWPPIVVIQNTQLEQDEQEKWIGMGNKELLDMFKEYCPMKARHAYGPHGHRGMSLVIFADSPTGYYNAERLAKQFKDSRRGKEHWDQPGKLIFLPGRDRILYGYMATAEDLDNFNRHSSGKSKLKWEVKKYQEAVAQPMRQMYEDNQQLNYLKIKVQKQKEHSKTLEKSMSVFTRKLELRENEISVIRERAKEQHGENQKEMDDLERTYKERIVQLQRDSARREQEMQEKQEEFKQEHIVRYQQLEKKLGEEEQQPKQATVEEAIQRQTEIVESSLQDSEDYEYQKRELMKQHHLKKREFMRKQYEEALEFEKELEKERQALLDNYRRQMEEASSKS